MIYILKQKSLKMNTGKIFLISTLSRLPVGCTQPPIQWGMGALSLEVKQPGREADHLPPASSEIKNMGIYTSPPPLHVN
jgi:hypothetical protein